MIRYISFLGAVVCALFLTAVSSAATIQLSANLEFNDPSDIDSGGTWTVVAKADESGIASITLSFLDATINFNTASGFLTPSNFDQKTAGNGPARFDILQGNITAPDLFDFGVINGSFASGYVDDPSLSVLGSNPDLGSFTGGAEIATGTFDAGVIPEWLNDTTGGVLYVDTNGTLSTQTNPETEVTTTTTIRSNLIPEPATFALVGLSLLSLATTRRR